MGMMLSSYLSSCFDMQCVRAAHTALDQSGLLFLFKLRQRLVLRHTQEFMSSYWISETGTTADALNVSVVVLQVASFEHT